MSTISSLGVGSGLDADALVQQLMSLERAPITQLETKKSGISAKISALGILKSALDNLKSASDILGDANKLSAFKATATDTSIVTASASGSSSAGTYSINVIRLATANKISLNNNFSSASEILGKGDFTITVGSTSTTIPITSGSATLTTLRDAINASSAGVTANIVSGDSGTKLLLTAKEAGQTVSVAASDTDAGDGVDFTRLSGTGTITAAQTAQVEVDGIAITSSSNTISSALGGVSLVLTKTGSTTLTVARDSSTVKTAVENYVKAYNDLQSQITSLTKYDAANKKGSTLTGDATVRSLQSQVYGALTKAQSSVSGSFKTLSELGVSMSSGGKLTLDSTKLQTAIDKDFQSVTSVLNAFGSEMETVTGNLTATGGILASRTDSLNTQISAINSRTEELERRMDLIEKRYRAQYSALDTIVASMKTTSTYLAQQIAKLS